ncbi:MAG: adenosylcobinamide-GDP ribazoletransferase [Dehalococcoidia bacterium]|nr:adenosylcobinamide-GDP ribazoletransferase [Dehalococcoidia bacterium]
MIFFTALRFLTIIPVPSSTVDESGMIGKSIPFFPVVGLLIGVILYGLCIVLRMALPMPVVSALLIVCLAILTGAHHLDGLIDTCDGMVAGKTREQRLSIMSDTRVGAFGITGICLLLLLKYAVISNSTDMAVLILFPVISRWTLAGAILIFPSARDEGLGFITRKSARWTGFIWATVPALLVSIVLAGLIEGLLLLISLFALTYCVGLAFSRLYGWLTGDNYGALVEIGETLALLMMIALAQFTTTIPGSGMFKLSLPAG